ncbi:MAG: DNA mismatch repair endonuclease MutL [Spirochaetota bacterium]
MKTQLGLYGYMPRIQVLPPETARLIAAGEVIDRPASLLRELIDNAIDAGASDIQVEIQGGGSTSVLVVDDGMGMDAEDLALSILPHATSKIRSADDLLTTRSLGFRGEALASIAAAARLEITSRSAETPEARKLVSRPESAPTMEATHGRQGTRVQVEGLFDNFPARRQFLKRSQAEASLCRQVFADKALAHPAISFRFASEGRNLDRLPACESFRERVLALHDDPGPALVHEPRFTGQGFEGRAVLASPAFYRADRRFMQVFVNRRRIQDYSLISGLDQAFDGLLPGGAHPFAFLYIEIDPSLADFNIHPAKREVRFRDPASIRHVVSSGLGSFLRGLVRARPEGQEAEGEKYGVKNGAQYGDSHPALDFGRQGGSLPGGQSRGSGGSAWYAPLPGSSGGGPGQGWDSLLRERPFSPGVPPMGTDTGTGTGTGTGQGDPIRYLGTAMELFLVVEAGDSLYLIDQHAAHERLLFDELSAARPAVQELLVPILYEAESDAEDTRIEAIVEIIAAVGFGLERAGEGAWALTSLPALLAADPAGALRDLLDSPEADPRKAALATTACRAAVKDGDRLEAAAALELARRALALPEPRCPHGRPVWIRMTRGDLFRAVRRIV